MQDEITQDRIQTEIHKRRTFGIISHPDAGKTTLTEKFLLFGGVLQQAGAIRAKKADRHAKSDWMGVEQERGISVTSSVMQFPYRGYSVNLLDTPGHKDFSEDTYRVLTAVDSALMVLDGAKGVESQTEKLMQVCRMRSIPIMTFINKLDRECREPLELLDEIENVLGIQAVPLTWPIGMGKDFRGVYDLYNGEVRFFQASGGKGTKPSPSQVIKDLEDPLLDKLVGSANADELRQSVELINGAGYPFDAQAYLQGKQTPVFFGSAVNNFGVQELLDTFVRLAPAPQGREAETREIAPDEPSFSGVVFKIQANMDPAHRDRIAFLRVCSGRMHKGMRVRHHRINKNMSLASAIVFMARDRAGTEEAWPGDIIGVPNHGTLKIGDTLSQKEELKIKGVPSFAPELFRRVILKDPFKAKQLEKGLYQLTEEGAIQLFRPLANNAYILGAAGALQFDVTADRLRTEYGVEATYEPVSAFALRWIHSEDKRILQQFRERHHRHLLEDAQGCPALFFSSNWWLEKTVEDWPSIEFSRIREN